MEKKLLKMGYLQKFVDMFLSEMRSLGLSDKQIAYMFKKSKKTNLFDVLDWTKKTMKDVSEHKAQLNALYSIFN